MSDNIKYEFRGIGLNKSEKYFGQKKFDDYCAVYHINQYSDMQLIEELVYKEILQENFKIQIQDKKTKFEKDQKELPEKDQKEFQNPTYITDAMDSNLEQILSLKEKLGLLNNQEGDDGFKYIQQFEDKFKKWCEENQDRTFACPHCSKMILLYMKQEYWETMKHPFFESKVLANKKLWELFKANKITKTEIAEVLGCSEKYIDWLESKIYLKKNSPSQ
jgi:hypothetical protein